MTVNSSTPKPWCTRSGVANMDGEFLKRIREKRGETQEAFAKLVNARHNRKYDKSRVSRWETGAEPIPTEVSNVLLLENMSYDKKDSATIISVGNRKGGSGKSTISSALGFTLSKVRRNDGSTCRVALIDADSQSNLSLACKVDRTRIAEIDAAGKSFYHVLMGKTKPEDTAIPTQVPGMDIIPSSVSLAFAERELILRESYKDIPANFSLRVALNDDFKRRYDFIIIDCGPSLGVTTLNPLCVSSFVLYAVQTESYAVTGIDHLTEIIDIIRKGAHPGLKVLGLVPTMFDKRNKQDHLSLQEMAEKATTIRRDAGTVGVPVFSPIPRSTNFANAAAANEILMNVDVAAPGVITFVEIAAALGVRTPLGE